MAASVDAAVRTAWGTYFRNGTSSKFTIIDNDVHEQLAISTAPNTDAPAAIGYARTGVAGATGSLSSQSTTPRQMRMPDTDSVWKSCHAEVHVRQGAACQSATMVSRIPRT